MTLPTDLAPLLTRLSDPDPEVRDTGEGSALEELTELVASGVLDQDLDAVADDLLAMLGSSPVQGRTFAVLVLGSVLERDATSRSLPQDAYQRVLEGVATWWSSEQDLRGWDDDLGWLHALAHGADTVADLGESRWAGAEDVRALLELAAVRVTTPTDVAMVQGEDDRIAYALVRLLARPGVGEDDVDDLVDELATAWRTSDDGPVAAWRHNAVHVARSLLLHLTLGTSHLGDDGEAAGPVEVPVASYAVGRLSGALAEMYPWLGRP